MKLAKAGLLGKTSMGHQNLRKNPEIKHTLEDVLEFAVKQALPKREK